GGFFLDRRRIVDGRELLAVDVLRVISGDCLEDERRVGCGPRHGPDVIERPGKWQHAARANQAVRRFQPGDPAACRWQTNGAGGVSADGAIAEAGCYGCT